MSTARQNYETMIRGLRLMVEGVDMLKSIDDLHQNDPAWSGLVPPDLDRFVEHVRSMLQEMV